MYRLKQSLTVYKKVAPFYPFGYDDSKGYFYEKSIVPQLGTRLLNKVL